MLCGLPVMLSIYPPMVDIPQHAAQIASLKAMIFGERWDFSELFEINLFTPYWLGYGLVMVLSTMFDIVTAMKLVVAGSLVLFVWAAARFCLRMGMPSAWRWAFLMLPFGFAYQWGFLNFVVAAPFGFLFLSQMLVWRENLNRTTAFKIVGFVHFLFFAHLLVAGFFCIIAVFLLAAPWRGGKAWLLRSLPVCSVIPITVLWMSIGVLTNPTARSPIIWSLGANRLTDFLPGLVPAPTEQAAYIVGIFILIVPWLCGATIRRSWLIWAPFLIYLLWMIFVPNYVGGNWFTYQRFGIFGLPLYYVGFVAKEHVRLFRRRLLIRNGLAAIAMLMVAWQCLLTDAFNQEMKDYRTIIETAMPGQRLLTMAFEKMSESNKAAPLMLHAPSWYQAEHGGLVEFSFARFWGMPLKFKNNTGQGIYLEFEWHPETFDWEKNNGKDFQYIALRHSQDASRWINEKTNGEMSFLARSGLWQLFGKTTNDQSQPMH